MRQHKSLRITRPRSTLLLRSRSSGDSRRPSPIPLEAPVAPIDHPPQDVQERVKAHYRHHGGF